MSSSPRPSRTGDVHPHRDSGLRILFGTMGLILFFAGCPRSTIAPVPAQDVGIDLGKRGEDASDSTPHNDGDYDLNTNDSDTEENTGPPALTSHCPEGLLTLSLRADWSGSAPAHVRTANAPDLDNSPMELVNGTHSVVIPVPPDGMLFRFEVRGDVLAPSPEDQIWWFVDPRFPSTPCTLYLDDRTPVETYCSQVDSVCTGTAATDSIRGSATGFDASKTKHSWTALLFRTSDPEPLLISRIQVADAPGDFDFGVIEHGLYRVILRPTAGLYGEIPTSEVMDIVEWRAFTHKGPKQLPEVELSYPLEQAAPSADGTVSAPVVFTWPGYTEGSLYSVQLYTFPSLDTFGSDGTWVWDSGLSPEHSTSFDGVLNQGARSGTVIEPGSLVGWRIHAQTEDGWLAWSHLIPITVSPP